MAETGSFIIALIEDIAVGPGGRSLFDQLLIWHDDLETVDSRVLGWPEKTLDTVKNWSDYMTLKIFLVNGFFFAQISKVSVWLQNELVWPLHANAVSEVLELFMQTDCFFLTQHDLWVAIIR